MAQVWEEWQRRERTTRRERRVEASERARWKMARISSVGRSGLLCSRIVSFEAHGIDGDGSQTLTRGTFPAASRRWETDA